MLKKLFVLTTMLFIAVPFLNAHSAEEFKNSISPIPADVQDTMKKYTWHDGCPVPISDLAYLKLNYWGFDHKSHQGTMIVNEQVAQEVADIFEELYQHHFPIEKMDTMDVYHGDDDAALAANNTSAFNCRAVTGQTGVFSQHSYGRAIDINTMINPYVKGNTVLPPSGAQYVNRNKPYPGKITKNSFIYKAFISRSWSWGGDWHDLKDYQHFEKRAGNEKRDPNGYPVKN